MKHFKNIITYAISLVIFISCTIDDSIEEDSTYLDPIKEATVDSYLDMSATGDDNNVDDPTEKGE